MTTAAYKIAAGAEAPSGSSSVTKLKSSRPPVIPQVFINKISKAFLDALYALLDGLVLLASEESPIVKGLYLSRLKGTESAVELRLHELLDLKDGVSLQLSLTSTQLTVIHDRILY